MLLGYWGWRPYVDGEIIFSLKMEKKKFVAECCKIKKKKKGG